MCKLGEFDHDMKNLKITIKSRRKRRLIIASLIQLLVPRTFSEQHT